MKENKANLDKAYDAEVHERAVYRAWEESGAFAPQGKGKPFAIMMPPPNVTGILHLGHALENAIMDTKIRFERMRGKRAMLIPGTDHAAVATQARVEKDLIAAGHAHPREEYGREKLLQIIRDYAEKSRGTILSQIRAMGTSCDWSRLAYTIDEPRSAAVVTMFKKMYDDGLIYRGYRVVNWSVVGQSACSDDELVYVERKAKVCTFKYAKDFPIPIATTRPETKLGDTAVAVHPDDKRYKKYIGKTFTADVGAAKPLSIRVIADKAVDPKFGTGAVGVTPAHSMIDFEMKERYGLELKQVIGKDGRMTNKAGKAYKGLTAEEAREKFVSWLKREKLFIKEEEVSQNVATSDRFGDVIEVLPMLQWFVDVKKEIPDRGKTLKDLMREAGEKIEIQPDRYKKLYYQWIDNLRDWCISRQVWWGHRIPVWYRGDEIFVGAEAPKGNGWTQDPDTLDTWFSSGLWTFSTLGWPEKTKDLKEFHPAAWMQMGYEILFFWMARMVLMSEYALRQIPFKQVYIHGILRDAEGKKFSKSDRNTVDPLILIKKYGTDALRLALLAGTTPGNDSSFNEEKVEHYQHFVNKFWNITRYIVGSVDEVATPKQAPKAYTDTDRWILKRLGSLITDTTRLLDQSDFSLAASILYQYIWNDFADWYIEVAKVEARRSAEVKKQKDQILVYVLNTVLRLAHPYIPFVTEVLWKQFSPEKLLIISDWPKPLVLKFTPGAGEIFPQVQKDIFTIREYRSQNKIPAGQIVTVRMRLKHSEYQDVIEKMARCKIEISDSNEIIVESANTLTYSKRKELESYIKNLESKLANKEFTKKAPKAVIEAEKKKLADAKAKLTR